VEHETHRRRIAPCREPVARVPVPPAAVHEDDPSVVASPPTTIVPLPVVIAERPIPLAAKRVTTPVIRDSCVASRIKGRVLCPVEVSIPIDRYVITIPKLVGVAKTINVRIRCPVHRRVSFTTRVTVPCPVRCDIPLTIGVEISCPVHRDIPAAIYFSWGR